MWSLDFIFNWSTNFKSVICCGSCKKNPHFLTPGGEYPWKIGNNIDNKLTSDTITIHPFFRSSGVKVSTLQLQA